MTMRNYAAVRCSSLLRRLAIEMRHAARLRDPESIHDLRVSIRRFQQCLIVFGQFFPAGPVKKIRRRLHRIMESAGDVRNRDIALELFEKSGLPKDDALASKWRDEAPQMRGELLDLLIKWGRRDLSTRWGSKLEL